MPPALARLRLGKGPRDTHTSKESKSAILYPGIEEEEIKKRNRCGIEEEE
jgi:hypothetical protein